jgi:hypothetical protein
MQSSVATAILLGVALIVLAGNLAVPSPKPQVFMVAASSLPSGAVNKHVIEGVAYSLIMSLFIL